MFKVQKFSLIFFVINLTIFKHLQPPEKNTIFLPFFAHFFIHFISLILLLLNLLYVRDWHAHTLMCCYTSTLIFKRRFQYWLAFCMFFFCWFSFLFFFKCTHKAREKMCGAWHGGVLLRTTVVKKHHGPLKNYTTEHLYLFR